MLNFVSGANKSSRAVLLDKENIYVALLRITRHREYKFGHLSFPDKS